MHESLVRHLDRTQEENDSSENHLLGINIQKSPSKIVHFFNVVFGLSVVFST